jgi:predicted DNA-binding protein
MKTKSDTMARTALFLRTDQQERLQVLSDVTGAPIAELIRRAIDGYLEQRKAEIRKG